MPTRAPMFAASLRALLLIALTLSVLVPTPVLAAKGTDTRVEVSAAPAIAVVSPGQPLAFRATFVNNGPGTITHLTFSGSAPGAAFLRADAPCAAAGAGVACDLGSYSAGASITITLVFAAPAGGTVGFSGAFAGDAGSGNAKSASSDVWPVQSTSTITVDASSGFFGTWQAGHDAAQTFRTIQSGGQQSTVTAHPVFGDYPVLLRHTSAAISCANAAQLGNLDLTGFGQVLDLSVAGGRTGVGAVIRYAPGDAPVPAQAQVLHQHDDLTCAVVPRCDGSNTGNCYTAYEEGRGRNKQLVIQVTLPHNGRIKGI